MDASRKAWRVAGDNGARLLRPVAPVATTRDEGIAVVCRGTLEVSLFRKRFCAMETARALTRR